MLHYLWPRKKTLVSAEEPGDPGFGLKLIYDGEQANVEYVMTVTPSPSGLRRARLALLE